MQLKSPTMYKQSPSRNQRSKGIKVKHVLQICLLLAVCVWLIYQVKHSHDKKKEFDEHEAKSSVDSIRKVEVVKLGRKDLHPPKEGTVVESDKHDEVEDEETEEETPGEEHNNKHEDEGKENKIEEKDENGEERGDVEEEVDDHDEEKSDVEHDQEEDFVDEEKERDDDEDELKDKESDDKNGQTDTGSDSQEHDNDGGTMRRHEAREENYKADDASSAVTSDNQITSNGNETVVLGKSNEPGEVNSLEPQNNLYHNDGVDAGQSASVNVEGGDTINEDRLGTTTNEKSETGVSTTHDNSTEKSGEVQDFSLLNGNGTVSEHNEEQSVVEEHEKSSVSSNIEISDPKLQNNSTFLVNGVLQNFNSTVSSESKSTDPNSEESHTHVVTESSNPEMKDDVTSKTEGNYTMTENSSVVENSEDDESKSKSSYDMELDTENSSDSKLSLEEKDVRTDLETLPNIKSEGSNSEDDEAE